MVKMATTLPKFIHLVRNITSESFIVIWCILDKIYNISIIISLFYLYMFYTCLPHAEGRSKHNKKKIICEADQCFGCYAKHI